jgi:hypothetical protein
VRDGRADPAEWDRCLDALGQDDVADIARDLAMLPHAYRLPWRWRTPTEAEGGPSFGYGYDSDRAASAAFESLITAALVRLPAARLETFMDVAVARRWSAGLATLVATYLSKLGDAPLPERFAPLLSYAFDDLHALPETVRARAPLVDRATLQRIVDAMPFDIYVGAGRGGRPHVYPRRAYLLADLCPSPALAARALNRLVAMKALAPSSYDEDLPALTQEAIAFFVPFFRAFGDAVMDPLSEAAARAAPQIAAVLQGVVDGSRR